jgi:energy-coupling factor transporter ATP-binding protein EcfA2
MRRAVSTLLILLIGGLVLWETLSWGSRTWAKYGLMKEPLPSVATFLPTSMIFPIVTTVLTISLIAVMAIAVIRSRKLFGLIPIEDLKRHVVVLGPTGSGKTTVAKAIIEKVVKEGKPAVIIDWKGEYVQFISGATIIRKIDNVWNVPGESAREKALVAVELIREMSRDTVEISPPSSLLLLRVLTEEYERGVPTTEKIVKVLERHAEIAQREGRHAEANMYLALVRRLFILLVDEERKAENVRGSSELVVYDLGGLPSIYLKTLYSGYVLASVYREAMKAGMSDGLKTLLIAEEAQNYIFARRPGELPSMAERTVYELRSFGVGVVLVCPDPTLLPEAVVRDVGTIVSLSPDTIPRFALERYLFRASLEEAEDMLKRMKKSRAIIYYQGRLFFLRRLPRSTKTLKPKGPKGDRMGVTDPGGRSLRTWPILPRRSPGRPAPKVVEVEERAKEKPRVLEVKVVEKKTEAEPEAAEVEERPKDVEPLRLEEELEEPEAEVEVEKSIETIAEEEEKLEEPEPAPKGPPIPSTLPYRGSLCPAGRSTTLGRALLLEEDKNGEWWVSGRVGTKFPVGDPLTPGGGPGRAELRLEEEEVKEESKGTEETKRAEEVPEAPLSTTGGWEIFGHLLVEDLTARGRVSTMKCVRCGFAAPLTGLKAFKERPCRRPEEEAAKEKAEEARPEKGTAPSVQRRCENCGREGATATLCDECAAIFERYSEVARPMPLKERGSIKPPSVPGVDGWGWVSSLTTFFPYKQGEEGREWWCPVPGCKKTARKLIEIVDHFRDAHPFEASRGWYEEFDVPTRRMRIRTWQGWVDETRLELTLEPEVERR